MSKLDNLLREAIKIDKNNRKFKFILKCKNGYFLIKPRKKDYPLITPIDKASESIKKYEIKEVEADIDNITICAHTGFDEVIFYSWE